MCRNVTGKKERIALNKTTISSKFFYKVKMFLIKKNLFKFYMITKISMDKVTLFNNNI